MFFFPGLVEPSELLANIEMEINKIKEEAQSRKDIMDRIDRWLSACEEENWLEEYNLVLIRSLMQKKKELFKECVCLKILSLVSG